jgi:hypothetical protein
VSLTDPALFPPFYRHKVQTARFSDVKPLSIAIITDGQASDPKVSHQSVLLLVLDIHISTRIQYSRITALQVLSDAIKDFAQFVEVEAPKHQKSSCPRDYVGIQFVQIGRCKVFFVTFPTFHWPFLQPSVISVDSACLCLQAMTNTRLISSLASTTISFLGSLTRTTWTP